MIMDSIMINLYKTAWGFAGLIPTFVVPADVKGSINAMFEIVRKFGSIFPVDTLFQLIALVIAWKSFTLIFYGVNWIIRKIPTVS